MPFFGENTFALCVFHGTRSFLDCDQLTLILNGGLIPRGPVGLPRPALVIRLETNHERRFCFLATWSCYHGSSLPLLRGISSYAAIAGSLFRKKTVGHLAPCMVASRRTSAACAVELSTRTMASARSCHGGSPWVQLEVVLRFVLQAGHFSPDGVEQAGQRRLTQDLTQELAVT